MKNLAGNKDCDRYIKVELARAKIPIVQVKLDTLHHEVPFTLAGQLGDFKFERFWYYWSVSGGEVPVVAAWEIYCHPNGKNDVRVDGHCGCPAPEHPHHLNANDCVDFYHIDTQEGLNMFVQKLRKHRLVPR